MQMKIAKSSRQYCQKIVQESRSILIDQILALNETLWNIKQAKEQSKTLEKLFT